MKLLQNMINADQVQAVNLYNNIHEKHCDNAEETVQGHSLGIVQGQ